MVIRNLSLAICVILVVVPIMVSSQSYAHDIRHWSVEEGLLHRNAQCIVQDDRGFIWIGTQSGLNRFDGKDFLYFTRQTHNLQYDEINHMYKDRTGRIWLINTGVHLMKTPRSIDIFDPYAETVTSFETFFGDQTSLNPKEVISFSQRDDGTIGLLTKDGELIFYDGNFSSINVELASENDNVDIHFYRDSMVYVVTHQPKDDRYGAQVLGFNMDGSKVVGYFSGRAVHARIFYIDDNGQVYFSIDHDYGGISYFMIDKKNNVVRDTLFPNILKEEKMRGAYIDQYVNLKVQNDILYLVEMDKEKNGLWIVDITGKNESIRIDEYDLHNTTQIFSDDKERIWIASQFGFYFLDVKENNFINILSNPTGEGRPIRGIEEDKNGSLFVVEENKALWVGQLQNDVWDQVGRKSVLTEPSAYSNSAFSVTCLENGKVLIGAGPNLLEFREEGKKFTRIGVRPDSMDYSIYWEIFEDAHQTIWLGTDRGDIGYLEETGITWLEPVAGRLPPNNIYHFIQESANRLWAASDAGAILIDPLEKKVVSRYWTYGKGDEYLPVDIIHHIHIDDDGSLWLGTGGTGLVHWEVPGSLINGVISENGSIEYFTRHEGLSNDNIYAVYEDENDNLWMSSDYGIIRFDKNSKGVSVFLSTDGISENEFNRIAHHQSDNGVIYFGGLNGVTSFNPGNFKSDSTGLNDPMVITEYQQFKKDEDQLIDLTLTLIRTDTIHMDYSDPFFRLQYSLLSYDEPRKTRYAYMIEGLDEKWSYIEQNFIRVNRLPYGNYKVKVKGQNARGYWSEDLIAIDVLVDKPYYLKNGFILLFLGGLGLLIYGIFKYRVSYLKQRQKLLEAAIEKRTHQIIEDKKTIEKQAADLRELDRVKSVFFANVSHELRTPLTLILGPINALLKKKSLQLNDQQLLRTARQNANELLKLVSSILDLSKIDNRKLELNESSYYLHGILEQIETEFASLANATDKSFEVRYETDQNVYIRIDKQKLNTCLKNLLSNAFKFTSPGGTVVLGVKVLSTKLRFEVSDTGRGISPKDLPFIFDRYYQSKQPDITAEGGTGIGLALTKELVELMGGEILVQSELERGSQFILYLPKKEVKSKSKQSGTILEGSQRLISQPLGAKSTLLVVEDHRELQDYLNYILSDSYNIITASHGEEGLKALSENPQIDLVISDIMMPVMDGFEFIAEFKSRDEFRHLPTIALTAKSDVKDKVRALRIGVDDYVTKPFDQEELLVRIERLLERLSTRKQAVGIEESAPSSSNATNIQAPQEHIPKVVMSEQDHEWLEELEQKILENMDDGRFSMDFLASLVNLSRRQLQRRLKRAVGLTPKEYINEIRMTRAMRMLESGKTSSVKQVSDAVGFSTATYFSKLFSKRFGKSPGAILDVTNGDSEL